MPGWRDPNEPRPWTRHQYDEARKVQAQMDAIKDRPTGGPTIITTIECPFCGNPDAELVDGPVPGPGVRVRRTRCDRCDGSEIV